jgi:hypothetical protein
VGVPYFGNNTSIDSNNDTIPSVFWNGPLGAFGYRDTTGLPDVPAPLTTSADPYSHMTTGQVAAMLYKLGDQNTNNAIDAGESFVVQLQYFMVSPGPDGKFAELYQGNAPVSASQTAWQAIINKSDDIYSFDP